MLLPVLFPVLFVDIWVKTTTAPEAKLIITNATTIVMVIPLFSQHCCLFPMSFEGDEVGITSDNSFEDCDSMGESGSVYKLLS